MPRRSKGIWIYSIPALLAIACAIGVHWRSRHFGGMDTLTVLESPRSADSGVEHQKKPDQTQPVEDIEVSATVLEGDAGPLPVFHHEFLQLDRVIDERIQLEATGQMRRRRLALSSQYPEPLIIDEVFLAGENGVWEALEIHLEIATEWIFKVAPADETAIGRIISSHGGKVIDHLAQLGLWTLRFEVDGIDFRDTLVSELKALTDVDAVFPNELIWPIGVPNDPEYATQWEFGWMDAERAWDMIDSASINDRQNVVAAIVDTGVNVEHADMSPWINSGEIPANNLDDDGNGRIDDINGFDFYTRTGDVQRTSGHGVGVAFNAGRVSNNGLEKASVAGRIDIMACVCFSTSGAGSSSAANNAIIYAVDNGARVINCSFVGGSAYTYMYALNYAESKGVIVVAGSGNNGKDIDLSPMYPVASAQSNVVGVGATESDDSIASYSNYGGEAVEIFAPAPSRGTSHATPMITAAVSLLIADDPHAPFSTIIDRLLRGVDKKDDLAGKAISEGRVNLLKSLRLNTLRRPDALEAYALRDGGVRLIWDDRSTAEAGFIVERSSVDPATVENPDDPAQMTWQVMDADIPANITYFDDPSTSATAPWFYRVRAKGTTHDSGRNFVTRVQASSEMAPSIESVDAPIESLYTQGSETAIRLAWFDSSDNESGFVLERSEVDSDGFYELARLEPGETTYLDSDVESAARYTYRLKTRNTGFGVYSETAVETAALETDPVVLNSPANVLMMTESHSSISLTWTDEASGEQGYHILRATSPDGEFLLIADLPPDATAYTDTDLVAESTYVYRIETYSAFGVESSGAETVTTPPEPPVLAEPLLSGDFLDSERVELFWVDSDSERQTGYVLQRALGSDAFQTIEVFTVDPRTALDVGLTPESIYRYRVGTTDGETVVYSNVISVETPPPPPLLIAPDLDFEVMGSTSARIFWVENSIRETGMVVERAPALDGPYTEVISLPAGSTEFTDRELTSDQTVSYRVRVQGDDRGVLVEAISEPVSLTTLTDEEEWRRVFFGTVEANGPGARSADPDGDGWTNLAEFATLQSPVKAQPYLALPGLTDDLRVTLQFDRRLNPTVSYVVQVSSDLNSPWDDLAELSSGSNGWLIHESGVDVAEAPRGDGGVSVLLTDGVSHAGAMRFLRLVIDSEE